MKTSTGNLREQRGIGFVGLIFILAICAVVLLLGSQRSPAVSCHIAKGLPRMVSCAVEEHGEGEIPTTVARG